MFLRYFIFIILLFNYANIFNLFTQDSGGLDFLDQLLKEIDMMEKSDESKSSRSYGALPVKSEPLSKYSDAYSSPKEEFLVIPEKDTPISQKDTRTLFLDPDVKQIKGSSGKGTKTRPSKGSLDSLNHYFNEFNTISYSVHNKIAINQDLSPQFKETKFIEFKKELEQANSLMDIIKDKGIYRSIFLKPSKDVGVDKKQSAKEQTPASKNVRQDLLNLLEKLQKLDTELGEPEENKESGVEALQKLASQGQTDALPKYKPLTEKKVTKEAVAPVKPNPKLEPEEDLKPEEK